MVVVRFAPSPTGEFHIGSLRTALYNFLFAKKMGGKFILRIEDTDQKRYVEHSERGIIDGLKWAGVHFDGEPVRQSERLSMYQKYAKELVKKGKAYYCFCTSEDLDQSRKEQEEKKLIPRYNRKCRYLDKQEIEAKLAAGMPRVIRLKVPETGATTFHDHLRGDITVSNEAIEDQVLLKSDGFPTYHLAVVVDDNDMNVSHIFRGDEWISSTPKHILLYQAFGWDLPIFIHLPPIQKPDKTKKLSKREGAASVESFRQEGYLPEALVNYLALLGWNPGGEQEIMTLDEMIQKFDIDKLQKAGAAFDQQRLDWFNQQYLMKLSCEQLSKRIDEYVESSSKEVITNLAMARNIITEKIDDAGRLYRLAMVERTRSSTLKEIVKRATEVFTTGEYDTQMLKWKKSTLPDAKEKLSHMKIFIEKLSDEYFADVGAHDFLPLQGGTIKNIENIIKNEISSKGWGTGDVLWPLRIALSEKEQSPSPFELLWALGKEESLTRIEKAITKI